MQCQSQLRETTIQVHRRKLLWGNIHNRWPQTSPEQNHCHSEDAIPQLQKEVQSFICMINYLSKFSTRLTELAESIRELVKEKVPFNWGLEHQESFAMLKKEIVRVPVLAYYNPQKETILQTDTNTKGLGSCLLQDEKPIYFASKAYLRHSGDIWQLKPNPLL